MEPSDADVERLKYCLEKLDYLNNVHYGDSSLLNLYHRIKDAPVCIHCFHLRTGQNFNPLIFRHR